MNILSIHGKFFSRQIIIGYLKKIILKICLTSPLLLHYPRPELALEFKKDTTENYWRV